MNIHGRYSSLLPECMIYNGPDPGPCTIMYNSSSNSYNNTLRGFNLSSLVVPVNGTAI
jgi:hypothetical protein